MTNNSQTKHENEYQRFVAPEYELDMLRDLYCASLSGILAKLYTKSIPLYGGLSGKLIDEEDYARRAMLCAEAALEEWKRKLSALVGDAR